jgi:2'-5' RNA ligase
VGLDGVHLTLRFLGTSSPAQIARLEPALAAAAAACPPMSVGLRGLDTFPARGSPRVLHLALEARPSLMALQAVCEAAAQATGYPPEARPFHPHLTLGRWRERAVRPSLPRVALPAAAHLSTLTLFRSQTRPDGAVYTPLRRFALGTEASP